MVELRQLPKPRVKAITEFLQGMFRPGNWLQRQRSGCGLYSGFKSVNVGFCGCCHFSKTACILVSRQEIHDSLRHVTFANLIMQGDHPTRNAVQYIPIRLFELPLRAE